MQEIIQFLVSNSEILHKVKEGTVCLIGVSSEELKAIMEVFLEEKITPKAYYWQ
ncbi:competence pheromone ComX [Bacillus infantis]|nr:competence pheromone ComX [Bacillus infantis]